MTALDPAPLAPAGVMPATEWAEIHDALSLALDALGDDPADLDLDRLRQTIGHQRTALRLAHKRFFFLDQLENAK